MHGYLVELERMESHRSLNVTLYLHKQTYIAEEVEEVPTLVKDRISFPTNNLKKQNSIAEHVRFHREASLGCILRSHITTENNSECRCLSEQKQYRKTKHY